MTGNGSSGPESSRSMVISLDASVGFNIRASSQDTRYFAMVTSGRCDVTGSDGDEDDDTFVSTFYRQLQYQVR